MKNERSPEELEAIAELERIYAQEKLTGGGNPVVEFFTHVIFISKRAFGRKRKKPVTIELVGIRGANKKFAVKNNSLPCQLQKTVEAELGTDDYSRVLDQLRSNGKR